MQNSSTFVVRLSRMGLDNDLSSTKDLGHMVRLFIIGKLSHKGLSFTHVTNKDLSF
jgi:hypothetical protein